MRRTFVLILVLILAFGAIGCRAEENVPEFCDPPTWDIPVDEPDFVAARGYILISSPYEYGWIPLPEEGEKFYLIRQEQPDGESFENLIRLTNEGVCIESSNCANRDCVDMGVVTLENRDDRILWNTIVCLPNQVMIELFTGDEAVQMIRDTLK